MRSEPINIAVDGPSGCGKSTLARNLARHYGYIYIDTGALYRTVGLCARRAGVPPEDEAAVAALLGDMDLDMRLEGGGGRVYLGGKPVGQEIRTAECARYASAVSKHPPVRAFLLETQRAIARAHDVVMDGRDIGTVVLPDAQVKIFMTAGDRDRAERRWLELRAKGADVTLEEVLRALCARDADDRGRAIAPAVPAADAVLLDNSGFTAEQTLAAAVAIVDEALAVRR